MIQQILFVVNTAIQIYCLLIFIYCLLSFMPQIIDRRHPVAEALEKLTAPVINPFRRMQHSNSGVDFSPLLAVFTLQSVARLLTPLLLNLYALGLPI